MVALGRGTYFNVISASQREKKKPSPVQAGPVPGRKQIVGATIRIYAKSLLACAYRVSLLGARAGYITPKLSVVNLLYLIKNDTPGLKPQNDTQLIYLLATTILGNLATVEVSSS
eukprot:SAG31_NODE_135_length_23206_cov_25.707967_7_plen_115_part_00